MANPDGIYNHENKWDNLSIIVGILLMLVPLLIAIGNLLHLWDFEIHTACPYYDSSGELRDDCR
ncbi:MAG TPA: hypothetical protein PKJ68_04605 [Candidatus Woesebacteria bacterium]|nr:hypothetical protein [Candidatus Woesebacteria bacterium]